jgi:hypothetical protein
MIAPRDRNTQLQSGAVIEQLADSDQRDACGPALHAPVRACAQRCIPGGPKWRAAGGL